MVDERRESGEISSDDSGRPRWGSRAAGLLIQREDTGQFLLALRSDCVMDPGLWGIPGGRVEPGERDFDAAFMESEEELGSLPRLEVIGDRQVKSGSFTYTTFHAMVSADDAKAWTPTLNWENDDWGWFSADSLPANTHPGVVEAIVGKTA